MSMVYTSGPVLPHCIVNTDITLYSCLDKKYIDIETLLKVSCA